MAPSASHAFIKIKLASRHALAGLWFMCKKLLNFIDVFSIQAKIKLDPGLIWPTL